MCSFSGRIYAAQRPDGRIADRLSARLSEPSIRIINAIFPQVHGKFTGSEQPFAPHDDHVIVQSSPRAPEIHHPHLDFPANPAIRPTDRKRKINRTLFAF